MQVERSLFSALSLRKAFWEKREQKEVLFQAIKSANANTKAGRGLSAENKLSGGRVSNT